MNSAFALNISAPTARAWCLTDLHRRRTGHAADRRIALVVEWVIWHVVLCNVVPDISRRPVGKRIDFDQTEFRIPLNKAGVRSLGRLITTNGCNPGAHPFQHFPQRLDFAKTAAKIGFTLPKPLPILSSLLANRERGCTPLEANAVARFELIPQSVSLREEQVCIEIKNTRSRTNSRQHRHKHTPFGAKTGSKCDILAKLFDSPTKYGFRRGRLEFIGDGLQIFICRFHANR